MSADGSDTWKLDLFHRRRKTEFTEFAVVVDGKIVDAERWSGNVAGTAYLSAKFWARDVDEVDVVRALSHHFRFDPSGRCDISLTDPDDPPGADPSAYGVTFTPYRR